jgi:predicted transcriptional regulator
VQGRTQGEIAQELQISQAAVSKILARADRRALEELTQQIERQKVRQTQRLDYLVAELMQAWVQSKADATRRRQRKSETAHGRGAHTVAEVTVETQHGDPRYLDAIRKVLADQRKLWGLDAPQRVDLRASQMPLDQLSDAELQARLSQQDTLLRRWGLLDAAPSTPAPETPDDDASPS